jgi:hypothetical protein
MGDGRALVHRDLGRGGELAIERANDQKAHGVIPFPCALERNRFILNRLALWHFGGA